MSFDVLLLKAFLDLEKFKRLSDSVPEEALAPTTKTFLRYFKAYTKSYPDAKRVDLDALYTMITLQAKGATPEQLAIVKHQIKLLEKPVDQKLIDGVVDKLVEINAVGKAGSVLAQYNAGAEVDALYELGSIVEEASASRDNNTLTYVDESVHNILKDEALDHGLKFPWQCLKDGVKGLLGGANVGFAGRVGTGKTSGIAQIVVGFAQQSKEYFEERPILWLNNEGDARRIKPRIYSAALGMTNKEMWGLDAEELDRLYCEAIGHTDKDFIVLKNFHGGTIQQVEKLVQELNPCVVITDMPAHIGGIKAEKAHDKLEVIFQRMREIAVKYNLIHLGTLQISVEGADMLYPPLSSIKDSKTGLQGALDLLLMLGSKNDAQYESLRAISVVKSKMPIQGQPIHPRSELFFRPDICRLEDGAYDQANGH